MKEVTIDEIKKILGSREERIRELWRRSRGLYEELENHEELIKSVSLPSSNSLYENQLNEKNRDLFDVIIRQKQLGYEQEQELLWALERQRYRENAWEVKEDKKPFWIFGNSLLLAAAVMVCVLSHPAVGVLALNVYFPCLGIAFLLLTVLIYLIVKRHRGE